MFQICACAETEKELMMELMDFALLNTFLLLVVMMVLVYKLKRSTS